MSIPQQTQAYKLRSFDKSLDGLVLDSDVSLPSELGPTEVLVEVHAVSLNARDYQIATGTYPAPTTPPSGLIPGSDASGTVLSTGSAVNTVRSGDRVVTHLTSDWIHGKLGNEMQTRALGGGIDGVLAKHVVLDQYNVLPIPDHLSFRQAASLPVAGLTAFHCLFGHAGNTLQPGQTLLVEGTGGVSIAALQLALVTGARPIVISSSDEKLRLVQDLGVPTQDCINYTSDTRWWETVKSLTPRGQGVDHTIEIAGGSTLTKALLAIRSYGSVWIVGYMDDYKSPAQAEEGLPDFAKAVLYSQANVQGVVCGSYRLFQQYLDAHQQAEQNVQSGMSKRNPLDPLIVEDQVFDWSHAQKAFQLQGSGKFVGKIIIDVVPS